MAYKNAHQEVITPSHKKYRPRLNKDEIRKQLQKALTEEPPPSMTVVADRLDTFRGVIRHGFLDLYNRILLRYEEYEQTMRNDRHQKRELVLNVALVCPIPIPVSRVADNLGLTAASLWHEFPDLCSKVAARYADCASERTKRLSPSGDRFIRRLKVGLSPFG